MFVFFFFFFFFYESISWFSGSASLVIIWIPLCFPAHSSLCEEAGEDKRASNTHKDLQQSMNSCKTESDSAGLSATHKLSNFSFVWSHAHILFTQLSVRRGHIEISCAALAGSLFFSFTCTEKHTKSTNSLQDSTTCITHASVNWRQPLTHKIFRDWERFLLNAFAYTTQRGGRKENEWEIQLFHSPNTLAHYRWLCQIFCP